MATKVPRIKADMIVSTMSLLAGALQVGDGVQNLQVHLTWMLRLGPLAMLCRLRRGGPLSARCVLGSWGQYRLWWCTPNMLNTPAR